MYWTMKRIIARYGDTQLPYLPTAHQHELWAQYVDWKEGCNDDGSWLGHCPMCGSGAVFAFHHGVLRCDGDCHKGKRAMSLQNAWTRMHQE